MRVIGMDIHRAFAEVVTLRDGVVTRLGRVDMRRDRLEAFARSTLTHDDHVVVEATGNAAAVVEVFSAHVGRVVIANPKQVRVIADAKINTDTIDATCWPSSTPAASCPRSGCLTRAPRRCAAK
jgi:hypothetical protein